LCQIAHASDKNKLGHYRREIHSIYLRYFVDCKNEFSDIKNALDTDGVYLFPYCLDGYLCYSLVFEKQRNKYLVREHMSHENGKEEDIDDISFASKNFNDLIVYLKEKKTNSRGLAIFNKDGSLACK
jgi:hypothetical protein